MKRRDFLKLTGVTGAATALPFTTTTLFAAHDGYTGPLYLLIDARGGWDTTSFCDPKGYDAPKPPINSAINNYPKAAIGKITLPGTTTVISPIEYAPPPDSFLTDTTLYTNKQFFEKYYERLLIVNGIHTLTNSHADGRRYNWSGELGRTGFPNFGALVASTLASERDMPFITNGGGYEETAGLVVPVRMSSRGVNALFEIAYPNRVNPNGAASPQYFPTEVEALINTGSTTRLNSLMNQQRLPRLKNSIGSLISARSINGHLKELASNLSTTAEFPAASFNGRTKARALYQQGRIALAAYESGVTASAQLALDPFDTHSNHDPEHYPILMDYLQGVDAILDEAAARGLSDRIVVIMASDFGRTPKYNVDGGKDHWPITSMMFMGNSTQVIQGNRVIGATIGATTSTYKAVKVDPVSLALDTNNTNPNSIQLSPADIHIALRKLAGIDQTQPASGEFRLTGTDLPTLFSG